MLIKLNQSQAIGNLTNVVTTNRVYVKMKNNYIRANDYDWDFSHKDIIGCNNFMKAEFYLEVEEE